MSEQKKDQALPAASRSRAPCEELIQYVIDHTEWGECQCGKCADKQPDRDAPPHSVDAGFFWVSARNSPASQDLNRLLLAGYPSPNRLRDGPSYIEMGGELGDQGIAILLIGLGELVGIWKVFSPKSLGMEGTAAMEMMGNGFLMPGGWQGASDDATPQAEKENL